MASQKHLAEVAVGVMQVYLGSVGRVSFRDEQRLYTRVMREINKISTRSGVGAADVWDQVQSEARRRGTKLALPGKDI